jgi:hypothetical protein
MNDKENHDADKTENEASCGEPKPFTKQELIEQLESQVNHFDTLPNHEKFSFCRTCDLYYFMLLVLNIFKKSDEKNKYGPD